MSTELEDRRKFLAGCGRFAVITPPTITALLSTSLTSSGVMASGGRYSANETLSSGGDVSTGRAAVDPAPAPTVTVDLFAAPMTVGSPTMGTP